MKRLVIAVSALVISAAIAPMTAQIATAQTPDSRRAAANYGSLTVNTTTQLTPFDLVFLARQGYLQNQGIPSYGVFVTAVGLGQVTAENLVQSAINANRLSSEALNDQGYLNAVNGYLRWLTNNR